MNLKKLHKLLSLNREGNIELIFYQRAINQSMKSFYWIGKIYI